MIDSRLVSAIVVLAVALRIGLNANTIPAPTELPAIRPLLETTRIRTSGVGGIEYQNFDPTAVVAVRPGADGLPGVGGTDDNMNGVVDDRLELGATRSDDLCVVLTADQLAEISRDQVMILQTGAFVGTSETDGHKVPSRVFVFGESDNGNPWSVLVDLADQ